jgi:hypothetical protein
VQDDGQNTQNTLRDGAHEGAHEYDITEVEREICRLPDVSIARIVVDDIGAVTEVHIVAKEGKHPKQIVRDVQSVALASFGIEIDRRVISVVQLDHVNDGPEQCEVPRPSIVGITAESSGLRSFVKVALALESIEAIGYAEGSIATTARHRLVAIATIDALRQLESSAASIDIDHAQVVRIGEHDIAVVTIVFIDPPSEHVVVGSALVRAQQDADAVARAVLDATNRRLARGPAPSAVREHSVAGDRFS